MMDKHSENGGNMEKLQQLYIEMAAYYQGQPKRIQHYVKVESFARWIGEQEGLSQEELELLLAAALVHDIGIRPAEEKFGRSDGKLQEQEGPHESEKLLKRLGFPEEVVERICYLVGHHHTYTDIQGMDYQILVEADFLVNFFENGQSRESIAACVQKIFRTDAGKELARRMYQLEI